MWRKRNPLALWWSWKLAHPLWRRVWRFLKKLKIHDIIHVSMLFSQISPPSPSPTESIRLLYTSVSLLLSRTQGYCYHLSKFHTYALVYCIGVFLSGLLHSKKKKNKKPTKNRATTWAAVTLLGLNQEKTLNSKTYMHPKGHSSTVYNSQDMEAT